MLQTAVPGTALPCAPHRAPSLPKRGTPRGEGSVCTHATGSCLYWGGGGSPHCSPQQVEEQAARPRPAAAQAALLIQKGEENVLQEL